MTRVESPGDSALPLFVGHASRLPGVTNPFPLPDRMLIEFRRRSGGQRRNPDDGDPVSAYERGSSSRRAPTRPSAAPLVAGLLLGACATAPEPPPMTAPPAPAWAAAIVSEDHDRLRRLPDAWTTALAQARDNGYGAQIEALGALADPGAALPNPTPPPGTYRCRVIKIGTRSGTLAYVAYDWFQCEVGRSADELRLDKLTGSQRHHGILYPDTEQGLVFLGTLALGYNGSPAPPYGADRERNIVGVMERFAPGRWRLVQPWPHFESNLDLLELEPV